MRRIIIISAIVVSFYSRFILNNNSLKKERPHCKLKSFFFSIILGTVIGLQFGEVFISYSNLECIQCKMAEISSKIILRKKIKSYFFPLLSFSFPLCENSIGEMKQVLHIIYVAVTAFFLHCIFSIEYNCFEWNINVWNKNPFDPFSIHVWLIWATTERESEEYKRERFLVSCWEL